MKKILLFVLLTSLVGTVCAQNVVTENVVVDDEVMIDEAIEQADSIVAEDAMAMEEYVLPEDPEWYVAPVVQMISQAPRRAVSCPVDSVLTFDVDSVLVEATWYEEGDTIRTTIWTCNPNGTRFIQEKTEFAYDASGYMIYSAEYKWDDVLNDWKDTKIEYAYDASHKMTSSVFYLKVNNVWMPDSANTYKYNAAGLEIEYMSYARNAQNQYMPAHRWLKDYNDKGKLILDERYDSYANGKWIGSSKEVWEFNATGSQTLLHEKYGWSNNDWAVSLREIKGYDAAGHNTLIENYGLVSGVFKGTKKEEYEYNSANKQTGKTVYSWSTSINDWVNSTKEKWEYNASNALTLHEKYNWSNDDWAVSLREITGYENGNKILVENYSLNSGVLAGTKKEEYTWNSNKKQTGTIAYKWTSDGWVKNVWSVTGYDEAGNKNETCKYNWKNDAWVGTGTRVLQTFNKSKKVIGKTNQSWSTSLNNWLNTTRDTTIYTGSNITQEASYTWSTDINDWIGKSRSDWHYNAAGLNDTIKTYTPNGTEWLFSSRTVNTYDTKKNKILVHNADWDGEKWVMTSMEKLDILYDAAGHLTLNATYSCLSDSVWKGLQKDTTYYSSKGQELYIARFSSWANNDWVPSYEIVYEYDGSDRTILEQRMDFKNNGWQGNYRYEYLYDEKGNRTLWITYNSWNTTTNNWIGSSKTETQYSATGKVEVMKTYDWLNNKWSESYLHSYQYDTQDREIEHLIQSFSNGAWVNMLRYEKAYHDGLQVKSNTYIWRNNQWIFNARDELTYDEDTQAKLRRQITGTWSVGNLISFTDFHYYYDCDYPSYTIQFKNYDGSLLSSVEIKEGKTPLFKDKTPTKPADDQYEYTFKGWDKDIVPATADAVYTATYTETKKKYLVTFKDEDGKTLKSEQVEYGATPTAPVNPTKTATAEYSYSFNGWDKTIEPVTGEAIYTAKYSSTKNKYLITFKNGDGSSLKSEEVEYGVTPTAPADPTKEATAEYSYTFTGWTPEIKAVTGEATYTATYSSAKRSYTITWLNDDGSMIDQTTVEYDYVPTHDPVTKLATAEYTYTFVGWTPQVGLVKGEASYTATFNATKNKYWITFKDEGGAELKKTEVEYGETPIAPTAPSKQATDEFSYAFAGWDKTIVPVAGEETYTATYSSTKRSYMITWLNDEGQMIDQAAVEYGVTPTHEDAEKVATAEFSYTFAGWTPEIKAVTGETSYAATFTPVKNKYTITFKDEDGTELKSEDLEYGETPIAPLDPTKPADEEYTYTFSGWDKTIVPVVGAETYTATYSKEAILVPTGLINAGEDARATKVLIDGQIYIMRGGEMFTLDGSAVRK